MKTIDEYKKEIISMIQEMEKEHGSKIKSVYILRDDEEIEEPMTKCVIQKTTYDVDVNF